MCIERVTAREEGAGEGDDTHDVARDDGLVRLVEVPVRGQCEQVLALDRSDNVVVAQHLVLGRTLHERDALLDVDGEEEAPGALHDRRVLLQRRAQLLAHLRVMNGVEESAFSPDPGTTEQGPQRRLRVHVAQRAQTTRASSEYSG